MNINPRLDTTKDEIKVLQAKCEQLYLLIAQLAEKLREIEDHILSLRN